MGDVEMARHKMRYTAEENTACAIFAVFCKGAPDTSYGQFIERMFHNGRPAGSYGVRIGEFKDLNKPPYIEETLKSALDLGITIPFPRALLGEKTGNEADKMVTISGALRRIENAVTEARTAIDV